MKKYFHRFIDLLIKTKSKIVYFTKHNVLFITFVMTSLLNGIFLRTLTVKNFMSISPILADLSFILIVGSFAYFLKPKNRFKYYITCNYLYID